MNLTLGRAWRANVFCSSLWIYLILVAIAVKSRCFCQPDGISITLLEDVYCTENFICSSLFATKAHGKYVYQRKKRSFLCLLLLICEDVEKCPAPTESNIQRFVQPKGIKGFSSEYTRIFS